MSGFVTIDYNKAQLKEMVDGESLVIPAGAGHIYKKSKFNVAPDARGIFIENRDQITVLFHVTGTMPAGSVVVLELFANCYSNVIKTVTKTLASAHTDELVQFDITDDLLGEADYIKIMYGFARNAQYVVSLLHTNIKKSDSDETLASLSDIKTAIAGVPGTAVPLAFTGVSAVTGSGLTANAAYEFVATEDCHFVFGDNACTATVNSKFLAAGVPRVYKTPGTDTYVAAIRASVDGVLFMTPIE